MMGLLPSCRSGDKASEESAQPGMVTYTIPGITFGMPSSVGPLQFAPVFTSRHTAEIAWVRLSCMSDHCHMQSRLCRKPQDKL